MTEALTTNYQEQANALKLILPYGDIDFIVVAPIIPNAPSEIAILAGREIALEATSEILAKKLAYRADSFTARDALDMSVSLELDRPSAIAALEATRHRRPALMACLQLIKNVPADELARSLWLTPTGERHATDLAARLLRDIVAIDSLGKPSTPLGPPPRGSEHDLLAIRNAIENASTVPVDDAAIIAILRGGAGIGPHLRVVFGDVSLAELARVGRLHGISVPIILNAYRRAKATAFAASQELDQALVNAW